MKSTKLLMAISLATALSASTAFAADEMKPAAPAAAPAAAAPADNNMEDCKIVKDGKGLIKENKADAGPSTGKNKAGDLEAMIKVPKGQCEKMNAGNFSSVSQEIKDKIEGAK